ncbi:uncharacterized protein LOC123223313 isoform X2 [Mangifera indica]|uniref:uncharacterized protein LOC123223313 isoform X2 n=1 Tax=Mangifera indica TaxID=29780 RepID=UPI001CFB876B|nr:uncharacterized protein LOC123223313 isoform X2 [Mangifera indica]
MSIMHVSSVKCGRIQVDAVMVTVSDMVKSSQKLSHFVHRSCTLLPPVMTFLRRNQMYWLFRRRPICTITDRATQEMSADRSAACSGHSLTSNTHENYVDRDENSVEEFSSHYFNTVFKKGDMI